MRNVSRALRSTAILIALMAASMTHAFAALSDDWQTTTGGHVYVAKLDSAPYPDDSRTTGYVTRRGVVYPKAGHYDDNSVLLFVPTGFRPTASTDYIIHFHGHVNAAINVLSAFKLSEMLAASQRNAVLVIPQGPKWVPDSGIGQLEKPGGFARLMADIQFELTRTQAALPDSKIGNIILGGHSGGYYPIGVVQQNGDLSENIRETWLWDAAYGGFDGIAKPSVNNPNHRIRSVFTTHLAKQNGEIMKRLRAAGRPFALVHDSNLSTGSVELSDGSTSSTKTLSAPADKQLETWLDQHRSLFIRSVLTHSGVINTRKYFERWARESTLLKHI